MELSSLRKTVTDKKLEENKIIESILLFVANFQLCIHHTSSLLVSKHDYKPRV